MEANFTNHVSDMCATIERLEIQVGQLNMDIKEQSSKQLPSDIEDDAIRECDIVTLSFEDELSGPSSVEKDNELAIEENES